MKPDFSRTHHVPRVLRKIVLVGILSPVLAACGVPGIRCADPGIGEIHTYHSDRPTQITPDSPAIRGLLELVTRYDLPINIHCPADGRAEIERALKAYPKATVIWAHTGTFLPPATLMDLLYTHPNLYFDLAIKNKRLRRDAYPILFGMTLREEWRQLFESYPAVFRGF